MMANHIPSLRPTARKWKSEANDFQFKSYPDRKIFSKIFTDNLHKLFLLWNQWVLKAIDFSFPSKTLEEELVRKYHEQRNFPAVAGTSKLGVHLRFGTVSIRQMAQTMPRLK